MVWPVGVPSAIHATSAPAPVRQVLPSLARLTGRARILSSHATSLDTPAATGVDRSKR
jgi:hypothetical protein